MEYQAKLNEKYTLVFILFQVLKLLLIKRCNYQFFISFCFLSAFTSTDIIFYNFLELHSTLSEKRFLSRIFPFYVNHCVLLILTWRSLEALRTKVFCWCSFTGVTSHPCHSPTESATERILLRLLGKVVVRVFFSMDWPFRVSLINGCNKNLLKLA